MSFQINVLNAKNVVASHAVKAGSNLTLDGQDNVNYQLVDTTTGFAPQNILATRDGANLVITLNERGATAQIVIKDYYDGNVDNVLVGLHENGNMYVYVPESGASQDAVSVLAEQVSRPQALGGEELAAPFWVWNPWWIAGAAGLLIGGVALAASGRSSDKKASDNVTHESVVANDPQTGNVGVTKKQGDPLTVDDVKDKVVIPANSGGTITAIGQVPTTDEAGNSTVPVTVTYPDGTTDTVNVPVNVTPLEITIELDPITADNKIDPTERANPAIPVTGTVTGDFKENDPITLTVNGKAYSGNVDRDGKFSIPVNGEDLHRDTTVDAKVETKNGTVTKTGNDDQPYEIVPFNVVYQPTPEALTLKQGDPLTVDDVKDKVVIPANSGGTITAIGQVPTTDEAGNSTVPVTVTYPDGTTDVVNVPVNVTPLEITIELDPITADNKIDSTEHANPAIPVTGTVTGDFKENDPITLTVNGKAYSGNVDRDGKFSIPVSGAELHADADLTIQAKVETTNGTVTKTAEDDQMYTKESFADAFEPTPAALSVKQGTPITEDDIKGKVTIQDGSNGQITHVGQIPATDMAGTKPAVPVTVTYPDGTTDVVNVPVEVTPLEITIELDLITADNKIDLTERANQAIPVTGTVTGDFKENDPITLTVNGNEIKGTVGRDGKFSIPVNGAELYADADLTIQAKVETKNGTVTKTADDDQTYTKESFTDAFEPTPAALSVKQGTPITEDDIKGKVTISAGSNGQITHVGQIPATDMAGTKPAVPVTVTYPDGTTDVVNVPVEVTPLTLKITLDPVTADNKIDSTEHANPAIPVTGTVTGDFKENDPITLTVNGKAYSGNVDRDGKFSIPVNGAELHADADLTIQAKVETTNGTVTKTADDDQMYTKESFTEVFDPTPAVLSVKQGTPITEDDIKGKVTIPAGSNGQITHVGPAPTTDTAGEKPAVPVTVTYPDGTTDVVNVPVEVTPLEITIELDLITADNKIDLTERANQAIPVTGTVTGDFKENNPITLTVNGNEIKGTVGRDGKFSIPVNGAELYADADLTIQAKVETTNGTVTKTADDDQMYTKESFAEAFDPTPAALSVKQGTPITEDDIKGKVTIPAGSNGQITHVGPAPTTDTAGEKPAVPVTVTYPDGTTDVVNVPVEVTPLEITIELDLITADNKIDLTERANQAIPVTGTVTGDFKENDPITLTVNGNEIKGTVGRDGKFSIPVNGAELYADADLTIQAKVETTNGTVTKTADDDQMYTKESFAEAFDPTPAALSVKQGTPITEDDIKGKVTIPAGSNGQITHVGPAPTTDTAGEKPAVPVTVTYPDGTTDVVNVPVNVTPLEITIELDPITADNKIDSTEHGNPAIPVTGTVTGDFKENDPITLTVNGKAYSGNVDRDGKFSIPVNGAELHADADLTIQAKVETTNGTVTKTADDDQMYTKESFAEAFDPTPAALSVKQGTLITEDDIKGKVTIPAGSNGQITHVGQVPTTDTAGEKPAVPVTVTYPDGTTDVVNVPVNVTPLEITIELDPITADNKIDSTEHGNPAIPVTGTVTGDFKENDPITLTVNGTPYLGNVDKAGRFSIAVSGAELHADADLTIQAKVETTNGTVTKTADDDQTYTKESFAEAFDPTPDSLTVKKGTPISEDDIKGKVAIPAGSGGTITQVGTPPATDTAGLKPAVPVTVTYPDGTTDTVNVPVTVTEADSDKFDPTPDSLTVKKGTPISEDDIKGKVAIPAGSGGTITQVGTPPATDTVGEKPAVPVTVTYPDGTTDVVNVPVTVTEIELAPLARDYFGQSDVITPNHNPFIPGDKDLVRVDIEYNDTYEFLDRYYGDQNLFLDQPIHMGKLIADRFQDDPRDEQPDQLKEVKITTSPLYGKLVLVDTAAGTVVDAGDTIQASDLDKLYLVNLATPEERELDDNDLTADQRIAMEQVGELKTTGKLASLGLTTENVNVGYLESAGSLLDHIGYQYVDTGGVGFNTSATETLTFGYLPFLQ